MPVGKFSWIKQFLVFSFSKRNLTAIKRQSRHWIKLSRSEKSHNAEFFLVRIFPHSDWIRRNTPYLFVFSQNAGKCGPEKTQYLDTFHAVRIRLQIGNTQIYCRQNNQVIKPIRMKKHGCKYFMEETNRFFLFTLV